MPIDTTNYNTDSHIDSMPITLELMNRMNKDLRNTVTSINDNEARYLVDFYYSLQRQRIANNNAAIAMNKSGESHQLIEFFRDQSEIMEKQVAMALDYYTGNLPIGRWARKAKGVGPVITAGILAHIDMDKAPTVGHIYSFMGQTPGVKWGKGKKRPWNAKLKTLGWKVGESFVKISNYNDGYYGHLYKYRKHLETLRNEAGRFKNIAQEKLETGGFKRDTKAKEFYELGKLPPAHIHARSTRWAVQIYISHLHTVWYYLKYQKTPPKPYVFAHLDHVDYMLPGNLEPYPELETMVRDMFPHAYTIEQWVARQNKAIEKGYY